MRQRERKQENTLRQKTGWLFAQWETLLVLIFLLVNIININLSPYYLNYTNLMNSMINFMDKGLMVFGIMMVLILGEIFPLHPSLRYPPAQQDGPANWGCRWRDAFWLLCWSAHCAARSTAFCWRRFRN